MSPALSVLFSQDCQSFVCFVKLKQILVGLGDLQEQCVDDLSFPVKPSKVLNLSRCRAGAVVITRGFLTFLETKRDFGYKIASCLRPSSTIAFLLGVTEWDIRCCHKNILVSYRAWPRFVIKDGNVIPSEAICAVRDLVFGPAESTAKTREKNAALKDTEPLQDLNKADKIQQKNETMKNTSDEMNERCPTEKKDKKEKLRKKKSGLENNGEKMKHSSKMSDEEEGIHAVKNADASEIPVKNGDATVQVTEEKNTKSLLKSSVIKREKKRSKDNGRLPEMNGKDMSEKDTDTFQLWERKEGIQEKGINDNSEILKEVDVREQTEKENTESEKTGNIQEITETLELSKTLEKDARKKSTSKYIEKLKRRDAIKKRTKTIIQDEPFEPLKDIDGMPIKESLQPLSKDEESKAEVTEESIETFHLSSKSYIQEKDDIKVQVTKRNTTSSKTSRKTDDTPKESSETSDKTADSEKKRKSKSAESSLSSKRADTKKKKKKKAAKSSGALESLENKEGLSVKDSESVKMLGTTDDTQERETKKSPETSEIHDVLDGFVEWSESEGTVAVLSEEKMENLEGIPMEIVMVPQRVDKGDHCVFLILTTLLNDLENIYVLLERNILKETPIHLLNPYVVFFFVPEQFLNVQGNVNVHIRHENRLLDVKRLSIMSASHTSRCSRLVSEATSPLDFTSVDAFPMFEDDIAITQTDNEEDRPGNCSDFPKTEEDEFADGHLSSLLKFVTHYGFCELNDLALDLLVERDNIQEGSAKSSEDNLFNPDQESSESVTFRETICLKKETPQRASLVLPSVTVSLEEATSVLRRSTSLPLLCNINPAAKDTEIRASDNAEDDFLYMEMSPGYSGMKPHELLLDELFKKGDSDSNRLNSLSSNIYVSMALSLDDDEDDDAAENELSESQQELLKLLKSFKTGDKTLPQVEIQFSDWLIKHQDSVDGRDVTLRYFDDDTVRKQKKRQSFQLGRPCESNIRKPRKKTKKEDKVQPQEAKTRQKTPKEKERCRKTLSKISDSSASSACSLNSDTCVRASPGNQERKRDSGNHSDSNEDNKSKTVTDDEKSTKWFVPPSTCPISDEGTPPSLPTRPPPSVPIYKEKPPLPARPLRKRKEDEGTPPLLPPKPPTLLKTADSPLHSQSPKKKNKSKDAPTKAKKYHREVSPDYITAKSHPRSPPKTRDQFKQALQHTPTQIRRNNYAMGKKKLSADPPRKSSAPEMRARSNSPRNVPNTSTVSRSPVSPLIAQKEHHSRYNKPLVPSCSRSNSCPDLIKTDTRDENAHTYIILQSDSDHSQNESYLHSKKNQGSKPDDPPPLPPR